MPTRILFCNCSSSQVVQEEAKRLVRENLADAGIPFVEAADLCALAAGRDPRLLDLARTDSLTIIACYPRAVRGLFHAAGAPLTGNGVEILNMRTRSAGEITERIRAGVEPPSNGSGSLSSMDHDGWSPWFPVIDRDRCNDCKQCLSFCLFGVYSLSGEGSVQVANPRNCKINCPACARICPQAAIIFPRIGEIPINGAEVPAEYLENNRITVDDVLGGDVRTLLTERRKRSKIRLLRKRSVERALQERCDCACDGDSSCGPSRCECAGAPGEICPCDCECKSPSPSVNPKGIFRPAEPGGFRILKGGR